MRVNESENNTNYGIQLLRILATLWIILFHFVNKGSIDINTEELSLKLVVLYLFNIGGGIGNAIFLLISGFFLWKIRHCAAGTYILADGVPAAFFQWQPLLSSFHFATTCREAAGLLVTSHRLPPYHPASARDWC